MSNVPMRYFAECTGYPLVNKRINQLIKKECPADSCIGI